MKRTVAILVAIVAILSATTTASAQTVETTTTQTTEITASQSATTGEGVAQLPLPVTVGKGQGLYDAGKALTITGVTGMAVGASMVVIQFVSNQIHPQQDPMYGVPMLPVFGAIFGGVGAVVSLIGLPICWGGKCVAKHNGTQLVTLGREQQGWMGLIDLGAGLDYVGSVHAVYGYNFNKHLFVGAGVGCEGQVYYFNESKNIPIYANVRVQLSKKHVSPYFGIRGGYDMAHRESYVGVDVGFRSQSLKSNGVWWGAVSICLGPDNVYPFMGIRLSRSLK